MLDLSMERVQSFNQCRIYVGNILLTAQVQYIHYCVVQGVSFRP
jgi:hypothetical protein